VRKRILGASQDLEHRRCERCTVPVRKWAEWLESSQSPERTIQLEVTTHAERAISHQSDYCENMFKLFLTNTANLDTLRNFWNRRVSKFAVALIFERVSVALVP